MSNTHYSYNEIIERLCTSAGWITVIIAAICMIFFFVAPVHAAEGKEIITFQELTIKIIRQGTSPLQSLAATKAPTEKFKTIAIETQKLMRTGTITSSTVTIQKFRYEPSTGEQLFWITATRGGMEVAINNPIRIGVGCPTDILISEIMDTKTNEITLTITENPKSAIEQTLIRVANGAPLGKAKVGTRE
jgi:hypothetical protein